MLKDLPLLCAIKKVWRGEKKEKKIYTAQPQFTLLR